MDLLFLGYPDQARTQSEGVILAVRKREHAQTSGWCFSAVCRFYCLLGDEKLFVTKVNEFARLTEEKKFPLWLAQARAYRGWIKTCEGNPEEGLIDLRAGVSAYKATGALFWLWREQGKQAEGYDLLAPIYNWFTEGFDAPDLVEARALLDELQG